MIEAFPHASERTPVWTGRVAEWMGQIGTRSHIVQGWTFALYPPYRREPERAYELCPAVLVLHHAENGIAIVVRPPDAPLLEMLAARLGDLERIGEAAAQEGPRP